MSYKPATGLKPLTADQQKVCENLLWIATVTAAEFPGIEDAKSEAHLALCEAVSKWFATNQDGRIGAYVRQAIRHALNDRLRNKLNKPIPKTCRSAPMDVDICRGRRGLSASALAQDQEAFGHLEGLGGLTPSQIMECLPERLRPAARAVLIEERSQSDAADMVGVSQQTVSRMVLEARKLLRDMFAADSCEGGEQ